MKVNASGGAATEATKLDPVKHTTHRWPYCMPDGNHVIYLATNHRGGVPAENGIYFSSLDGKDTHEVVVADGGAEFASGFLLFHAQNNVMAQHFDPASGKLSGEAVALLDRVKFDTGIWRSLFTVSQNGRLAYFPGGESSVGTQLILYDRSGKPLKTLGERTSYMDPALSPDGKQLAYLTGDPLWSVWILDLERGTRTRVTFDPEVKTNPTWSPDGKTVAYLSRSAAKNTTIVTKPSNGTGAERTLVDEPDYNLHFPHFTADGKYIVYMREQAGHAVSIVARPVSGGDPITVVSSPGLQPNIPGFAVSPDGKWIAYTSDETGKYEIYLAPFPSGEGKWQVSNGNATGPIWRQDSRELFFLSISGGMSAVDISGHGNEVQIGTPKTLFSVNIAPIGTIYDAFHDGQHFVFQVSDIGSHEPLNLITDWLSDLKK
jgi:eukaryotic-like serine/threonine-protein kinase